ncbi:unc-112-related protein-like, partial [Asbolus verrucosus]
FVDQLQVNLQTNQPQPNLDNGNVSSPVEDDIDAALTDLQTTLEGSSINAYANDITQVPELCDELKFLKSKRFTLKAYKKYWFTCRDLHLYLYKTREEMIHRANPVQDINLRGCEVTPDVNISQHKFGIKLEVPSAEGMSEMYIRCVDEHQYAKWMACCRLAAKGRSLADSSYESEKQTILDFFKMQRPSDGPVAVPNSFDIQLEDYLPPKFLKKLRGKVSTKTCI